VTKERRGDEDDAPERDERAIRLFVKKDEGLFFDLKKKSARERRRRSRSWRTPRGVLQERDRDARRG
jgi:hypothetical protein